MIKRNPLVKTKSQTIRKKEVKELLSDVGINFFDNKEWEQFEVWPKGNKRGEDSTYFTIKRSSEDLEDALQTGLDMAKRLSKGKIQNPRKCRTFQAKRKVGKRVIKVTRKICRNPSFNRTASYYDLEPLLNKNVEIFATSDGSNFFGKINEYEGKLKYDRFLRRFYIGKLSDEMRNHSIYTDSKNYYFYLTWVDDIKNNKIYITEPFYEIKKKWSGDPT